MTAWIADGEKYALIGLAVQIEQPIPLREIAPGLLVWTTDRKLPIPDHWREWLGTVRAGEIEGSNLILLSKMQSSGPDILDAENQLFKVKYGPSISPCCCPARSPPRTGQSF